jgi:integrase
VLQRDIPAGGLERRREPADRTKAIPYVQLDRLWRRNDIAVREKALWRLLYETVARALEVLSLNVEDLDLENKRAPTRAPKVATPNGCTCNRARHDCPDPAGGHTRQELRLARRGCQ